MDSYDGIDPHASAKNQPYATRLHLTTCACPPIAGAGSTLGAASSFGITQWTELRSVHIHVFDSGLTENSGHHEHFARGLLESPALAAHRLTIYAHRDAKSLAAESDAVRPVFRQSMYHRTNPDPWDGALSDFHKTAESFAADLATAGARIADGDLCLFPTATIAELKGFGDWVKASELHPAVAAIFHWGDASAFSPGRLDGALARLTARTLEAAELQDVWVSATQERLAGPLSAVFGTQPRVTSSVTFHPQRNSAGRDRQTSTEPIKVGLLGTPRGPKGFDAVLNLLDGSQPAAQQYEFLMQAYGEDYPEYAELQSIARNNLTLYSPWLPEETFLSLLESLDCALLPYNRRAYAAMVSGIFTLAAGLGLPLVVPSGTWMSERIDSGEAAGVVYEGEDHGDLLEALHEFSTRREELTAQAASKAEAWRRAYSAERMIEDLLMWTATSPAKSREL